MKRTELALAVVVLAFAAFVGREALRAPRRAAAAPLGDTVMAMAPAPTSEVPAPAPAPAPPPDADEHARVEMRFTARPGLTPEALDDARRRLRLGAPGTWMDDVLAERDSLLVRWRPRDAEPLRVWIAPARGVANRRGTFDALVRDAFTAWAAAGAPVRVTWVTDSARADVPVTWVEAFPDERVGVTTVRGLDGELMEGAIVLATHTRAGQALDEAWLRAIALHEVGHLLGLPHAASDTASIMRPHAAQRGLSRADRSTMRLLYSLPQGSLK